MAERLTEKIFDETGKQQDIYEWSTASSLECNRKLGKLEDIMEKYGIESLDILEQELKIAREIERLKNKEFDLSNSAIVDKDFYKDLTREIEKLETDRDIWKRACESMAFNYDKKLTCNTCYIKEQCSKQYGGNYEQALCNYFYQQAKKERNDEN